MYMTSGIWPWLAAALTLAIYSFLYKDNPFYKVAEYIFVGLSAGYWASYMFWNYAKPNLFDPLFSPGAGVHPNYWNIIPIILGFMMFTQLFRQTAWVVRFPLTFVLGVALGLQIIATVEGDIIPQLAGTFAPFLKSTFVALPIWPMIGNIVLLVGVITALTYFYFSMEHRGAFGTSAKIGVYFLMISFGASFGYTVMARISLLIGRFQFLLTDWLHVVK
ncbi:MAG TPA: hypothetical protein VMU02_06595 [bacterium]|nr:hypothetical protein [bacterium]